MGVFVACLYVRYVLLSVLSTVSEPYGWYIETVEFCIGYLVCVVGGILRNISSVIAIREDYREKLRSHQALETLLTHLR